MTLTVSKPKHVGREDYRTVVEDEGRNEFPPNRIRTSSNRLQFGDEGFDEFRFHRACRLTSSPSSPTASKSISATKARATI